MGAWVYTPAHPNEPYVPLHTRIQPNMCMSEENLDLMNSHRTQWHNLPPIPFSPLSDQEAEQCEKYSNTTPFESYQFQWNEPLEKDLSRHKREKICFVGASHSGVLFKAVSTLRREARTSESRTSDHIHVPFHEKLTEEVWSDILFEKKCKRIVFGFGQHPASFIGHRPTLFPEYYQLTESLMNDIIAKKELLKMSGADVYFRSMHYSSLMNYVAGSCPGIDWRSPPVVDEYNKIERKLCMKYGIPFIDTNFLVSPVWDSAHDWSHLNPDLAMVEAQYIIGQTRLLARNSVVIY